MDDDLIDSDGLSLARKSVLPGTGFFYPDSLQEDRKESEAAEALTGAETVVVADTDADGLGCVALVREAVGEAALLEFADHLVGARGAHVEGVGELSRGRRSVLDLLDEVDRLQVLVGRVRPAADRGVLLVSHRASITSWTSSAPSASSERMSRRVERSRSRSRPYSVSLDSMASITPS